MRNANLYASDVNQTLSTVIGFQIKTMYICTILLWSPQSMNHIVNIHAATILYFQSNFKLNKSFLNQVLKPPAIFLKKKIFFLISLEIKSETYQFSWIFFK